MNLVKKIRNTIIGSVLLVTTVASNSCLRATQSLNKTYCLPNQVVCAKAYGPDDRVRVDMCENDSLGDKKVLGIMYGSLGNVMFRTVKREVKKGNEHLVYQVHNIIGAAKIYCKKK